MSINLKSGVIALIGDEIEQNIIKNFAHKIDLFIKYGSHSTKPIQIQIDKKRWREISDEKYYIIKKLNVMLKFMILKMIKKLNFMNNLNF